MTTHSKGWNDDYSSDEPEYARRQERSFRDGPRSKLCRDFASATGPSFAPATGSDTRQPEMVSKEAVLDLIHQTKHQYFKPGAQEQEVRVGTVFNSLDDLFQKVRKL